MKNLTCGKRVSLNGTGIVVAVVVIAVCLSSGCRGPEDTESADTEGNPAGDQSTDEPSEQVDATASAPTEGSDSNDVSADCRLVLAHRSYARKEDLPPLPVLLRFDDRFWHLGSIPFDEGGLTGGVFKFADIEATAGAHSFEIIYGEKSLRQDVVLNANAKRYFIFYVGGGEGHEWVKVEDCGDNPRFR